MDNPGLGVVIHEQYELGVVIHGPSRARGVQWSFMDNPGLGWSVKDNPGMEVVIHGQSEAGGGHSWTIELGVVTGHSWTIRGWGWSVKDNLGGGWLFTLTTLISRLSLSTVSSAAVQTSSSRSTEFSFLNFVICCVFIPLVYT